MKPKKIKSSDFAGLVRPAPEQTNAPRRASANPSSYGYEGNYGSGGETDNPSYGSGNPSYNGDSYYGGGYKVYTVEEFYNWEGVWPGGYVEGMGYVMGDVVVYGEYTEYKEPYKEEYDTPDVPSPGYPPGYPKPDYPEQPYEEYYLVYDPYYYNEGYPGGGGGTSTPSGPSASQTDGVDITNSNNFKINTDISPVFTTQLTRILTSNSVIKKMLNYFDNGHVRLNIGIEKLEDQDAGAMTHHNPGDVENFYINFNSRFITDNGWVVNNNEGTDNIGFDWSQVKTKEEALLVTLAHEAIHAQYYALFYDFFYLNGGDAFRVWRYFTEHDYPKEFIDIFIKDGGTFYTNDEIDSRMHEYMRRHDRQRIQDALDEYRNDFP